MPAITLKEDVTRSVCSVTIERFVNVTELVIITTLPMSGVLVVPVIHSRDVKVSLLL